MDREAVDVKLTKIRQLVTLNVEADNIIENSKKIKKFFFDSNKQDINFKLQINKNTDVYKLIQGIASYYSYKTIPKNLKDAKKNLCDIQPKNMDKRVNYLLGKIYSSSEFEEYSLEKACKYYKTAIVQSEISIRYEYAVLCEQMGNMNEAVKIYKSLNDDVRACKKVIYFMKIGIIPNKVGHLENLLRHILKEEPNNVEAKYELAKITGKQEEKKKLLKENIEHNHIESIKEMINVYKQEDREVEEIENLYLKAIELGDKVSYYSLGELYMQEKYYDKEKAREYLEKASNEGIMLAKVKLSKLEK